MKIGKTFTFEAAHRLQRHDGKCHKLHGHSYRVDITIEGDDRTLVASGPSTGMLIDFGHLKGWWEPLEKVLDHMTILESSDPLAALLRKSFDEGGVSGVTLFDKPPTAENIAAFLQANLTEWLRKRSPVLKVGYGIPMLAKVRVYEGGSSWAEAE